MLSPLCKRIAAFMRHQGGATAIEYGLLIAVFSLGLIASSGGMADRIVGVWTYVSTNVTQA